MIKIALRDVDSNSNQTASELETPDQASIPSHDVAVVKHVARANRPNANMTLQSTNKNDLKLYLN